jgi:hypothetical protein
VIAVVIIVIIVGTHFSAQKTVHNTDDDEQGDKWVKSWGKVAIASAGMLLLCTCCCAFIKRSTARTWERRRQRYWGRSDATTEGFEAQMKTDRESAQMNRLTTAVMFNTLD